MSDSPFRDFLEQFTRDITPGIEIAKEVKKRVDNLGKPPAKEAEASPIIVQTASGAEVVPKCGTCNDKRKVGQPGFEVPCPKCAKK